MRFGRVAVLFARRDSVYKTISGCDVWDADRDAMQFTGNEPVIAHLPCRMWGRLRQFDKPVEGEQEFARFAVDVVRRNGGVLEHPSGSLLWQDKGLPAPGQFDQFGGFTIAIKQFDFGHPAEKPTWLYVCGIARHELPPTQMQLGEPDYVINTRLKPGAPGYRKECSKKWREATPLMLACWLRDVAVRCRGSQEVAA